MRTMHHSNKSHMAQYSLLMLLVYFLCSSGCSQMSGYQKSSQPKRFQPELREWYDIYYRETRDIDTAQVHVGFLYKKIKGDDLEYHVRNLKDKAVGFVLRDLQAFKYTRNVNAEGKPVESTEALGNLGLEGGIRRILGFKSGFIILKIVTDDKS